MKHPGIHRYWKKYNGFTLIEAMVAMAIMGILVAVAVPSIGPMVDNRRLESVISRLSSDMELARMSAVRRNGTVNFSLVTGASWCFGYMDDGTVCDCNSACDHSYSSVDNGNGMSLASANTDSSGGLQLVIFDAMGTRANTSAGTPTITITGGGGGVAKTAVNPIGHSRLCSDDLAGYRPDGDC